MVQRSKQWVSPDKINHPAPGIFPFPAHPASPFLLTQLLSLNLPFPFLNKKVAAQQPPYCHFHIDI